jgi:hypothetical protein
VGVSSIQPVCLVCDMMANQNLCRITRLMGESFQLHSQALIGYVDDVEASSNVSTPSMTSQGADEDSVY